MKLTQFIKNQKGITIIEGLVAFGILGVVTLGFMGFAKLSLGGLSNVKENTEITNSMARLRDAFGSDEIHCTKMLGGRTMNTSVPEIRYYNAKTDQLSVDPFLKIGTNVEQTSSVQPSDMVLRSVADLGPAFPGAAEPILVIGNLEINFAKANGPALVVRRIPLYIHLQGGQILRCSTSPLSSVEVNDRICSIKADGYAYYNPDVRNPRDQTHCLDTPDVQWTAGNQLEAKCNPGWKVAISEEHLVGASDMVCAVNMNNGIALPPRTYVSGFVDDDVAWASSATLDWPNSTCRFTYAFGIDTSGYTTAIKCARE